MGPFSEPFSPPKVVFRNRVKLGQVKRNHLDLIKTVYFDLPFLETVFVGYEPHSSS